MQGKTNNEFECTSCNRDSESDEEENQNLTMSQKNLRLFRKNTAIQVGMDIATMHESNSFIKALCKIIK